MLGYGWQVCIILEIFFNIIADKYTHNWFWIAVVSWNNCQTHYYSYEFFFCELFDMSYTDNYVAST